MRSILLLATMAVIFAKPPLQMKECTEEIHDITDISYAIANEGWESQGTWQFIFGYESPVGNYTNWKIRLEFAHSVTKLTAYQASADGPHTDGRVWFLTPQQWNFQVTDKIITGTATAETTENSFIYANALLFNRGLQPPQALLNEDCSSLLYPKTLPVTTISPVTAEDCDSPSGATELSYEYDNPGWQDEQGLGATIRYSSARGDFKDWSIKLVFSEEVILLNPHNAIEDGPYNQGFVWFLKPLDYNSYVTDQILEGSAVAISKSQFPPNARVILFNYGATPDTSLLPIAGCTPTDQSIIIIDETTNIDSQTSGERTSAYLRSLPYAQTIDRKGDTNQTTPLPQSTEHISTTSHEQQTTYHLTTTIPSTRDGWKPGIATGHLPTTSEQTTPKFKPSDNVTEEEPFDYNEVLHKSILFYEAQRSGKLPGNNRIPWRGDSGLRDGCFGGMCITDLTGGWYDAGDHMKFGFPMAWTTTVLAWGMIEFRRGYKRSGEWRNALSTLKWATDYLLKAHVSPNELYFQVGDPIADHNSWGHPETMTMERPIFKIDEEHPGSEVAAETAAALAASSLVFRARHSEYATTSLQHAIKLYHFADTYRGNYHESVPESRVQNFYKSFSGFSDELMWAAMWLFRATKNREYLRDAMTLSPLAGESEFSWDQKGPGALVLLSKYKPEFKPRLYAALERVITSVKTPDGLVFIQPWGTNRHAANYALIAIIAAKQAAIDADQRNKYLDFGRSQIMKLLGKGDNDRSYVVGFGENPPKRPHHRSSSCRSWNSNPASRTCDFDDFNSAGPNPHILYGALVGGPGRDGVYADDRADYVKNEVAIDYNAGFQSAVAGLRYFQILEEIDSERN